MLFLCFRDQTPIIEEIVACVCFCTAAVPGLYQKENTSMGRDESLASRTEASTAEPLS